jgi:hypothetical protein
MSELTVIRAQLSMAGAPGDGSLSELNRRWWSQSQAGLWAPADSPRGLRRAEIDTTTLWLREEGWTVSRRRSFDSSVWEI